MPNGRIELPPGPRLPAALQTLLWHTSSHRVLEACQARYGDIFAVRLLRLGTWVFVSHPEMIKQVFTAGPRMLHAGECNRLLQPIVGRTSLFMLDEDAHLSRRKLMLGPFHGERMKRHSELVARVAAEEIESWPTETPYRLRPRMQALTLTIMLRVMFGMSDGARLEELRRSYCQMMSAGTNPILARLPLLLGADRIERMSSYRRKLAALNEPIFEEIARRRTAPDLEQRSDVMSFLLQARHADGSPMSDVEVRDELVTLMLAGYEVTAHSLAWIVERLCRHPEKLRRVSEEVRAGESAYLTAIIQETLRVRPVISMVPRVVKEPTEIGGYVLPAGTFVLPSIRLLHMRSDVYPQPREFRPERFLERPPGTYTWVPYGGGQRRCLGAAFAEFEMTLILREILLRRTLEPSRPASERMRARSVVTTPHRSAEVLVGRSPAP